MQAASTATASGAAARRSSRASAGVREERRVPVVVIGNRVGYFAGSVHFAPPAFAM